MAVFTALASTDITKTPSLLLDALASPTPGLIFDASTLSVISGDNTFMWNGQLISTGTASVGLYDGSLSQLGIGAGLLLTSGTMPGTSNTTGYFGVSNYMAGDPDLDAVINKVFPTQSYDATSISVSFTIDDPTLTGVSFNVVFGSDEFPEWVDQFVDIAAIWVNGTNVAYFNNNPLAPLSVIGSNLAAGYFIDNTANLNTPSFGGTAEPGVASRLPIEYDGVSAPLTIYAPVHQGLNTLKIAIADAGDHIYDSGVFVSNMQGTVLPSRGITLDVDGSGSNDDLQGSSAPETMRGLDGDDDIKGYGGDDIVQAGAGDDFVTGGSGDDTIDGGLGEDTANYAGAFADYSIVPGAGGLYTVTDLRPGAPDGTDTLSGVENIQFSDITLTLATMTEIGRIAAPAGTVPVKSAFGTGAIPAELPGALEPEKTAMLEDGKIVPIDAFTGIVGSTYGLSVVDVPAVLPPGVTFSQAVHAFYVDPSAPAYQSLSSTQFVTHTFNFAVTDGTATTPNSVTFTVYGTNDAPVVSGPVMGIVAGGAGPVAVNALANATDADDGAVLSVVASYDDGAVPDSTLEVHGKGNDTAASPVAAASGGYTLTTLPAGITFDAAANQFTLDPANPAFAIIPVGEVRTYTIHYGVSDGIGEATPASVVFSVAGTYDAPVVTGALAAAAHEDDAVLTVSALANVTDANSTAVLSITSAPVVDDVTPETETEGPEDAGTHGALGGHGLHAGATLIFGVANQHTGVDGAEDVSGETAEVEVPENEAAPAHAFGGTYDFTALPPGVSFDAATGSFSLDPADPLFQTLSEGEPLDLTVRYGVTDGLVTVADSVTFTLTGVNDLPVVGGALAPIVLHEDAGVRGYTVAGLLSNVTDVDFNDVLTVDFGAASLPAGLSIATVPGGTALVPDATQPSGFALSALPDTRALLLDTTGAAFQPLAQGETQTVHVSYTVSDGFGTVADGVDYTIIGTNDAPVVAGPVAASVTEDDAPVTVSALANAFDIDHGAVLSVTNRAPARPIDSANDLAETPPAALPGAPLDLASLPAGVTFDAATNLFTLDTTAAVYQALAEGQTKTVTVNYGVTDGMATADASAVFTVTGVNDAPVVHGPAETQAVEDQGHGILNRSQLLANVTDVDAGTVLDVQFDAGALPAGVVFSHTPGSTTVLTTTYYGFTQVVTVDIPTVDTLTLDTSDAAYQALAAGETLDVGVDYTVSDGWVAVAARAVFHLAGSNDAPIVAGPLTASANEGGAAVTLNGLANASDIDHGTVLRVTAAPAAAPEFENFLNAAGVVEGAAPAPAPIIDLDPAALPAGVTFDAASNSFSLDPSHPALRALSAGQVKTLTVNYGVSDGIVATAARAVFTVVGTNEAPVVSGPVTVTVTEDGATAGFRSTTVVGIGAEPENNIASTGFPLVDMLANASDVDALDQLTIVGVPAALPTGVHATAVTGGYYQPDVLAYSLDTSDASFQSLAAGEETTVTLTYQVSDGTVSTAAEAIFRIIGANDAPVIATPAQAVAIEDGAVVTLDALANASDADHGAVLSVVNVPAALPAGVTYDAASHVFTLDPSVQAYQALSKGQTAVVSAAYGVSDGIVTTNTTATFVVTGTNDLPVIAVPQSFAVMANTAAFTINPVANATDIDAGDVLSLVPGGTLANGVHSVVVPGGYYQPNTTITQFNPNDAVFRALAANEAATVVWDYDITDGSAIVHDSAVFQVTGVNDAPIVSGTQFAAAAEDGASVTVDALANASDVDHGAQLSVVNVPLILPAGVTYDATAHAFTLNPADASFQQLAQGEVQHVVVTYGVSDGALTTVASVQFDVTGTNDAPVVLGPVTATPNEGSGVITVNPLGNADDVDAHQGLHVSGLPGTLPAGVTFDAAADRFLFDSDNAAYDILSEGESLDVTVAYNAFDGFVEVPASTIFQVRGKNDAPVVHGTVAVAATENDGVRTVSLLGQTTDVDHLDVLNVLTTKGNAVTATVTSGTWAAPVAFTVANNLLTLDTAQFRSLGAGDNLVVTFNYLVSDGNSAGGGGGNISVGAVAATTTVTLTGQNNAPTALTLSSTHIAENSAAGTVVGQFSAADLDRNETQTFELVSDAKGYFAIAGNKLVVAPGAVLDYETVTSDTITVKVTDAAGGSVVSGFTIAIDNLPGAVINGTTGNDTYTPFSAVATTGEDDIVNGDKGNDFIDGGAGNDTLTGGLGADIVNGGDGNDRIIVSGSDGIGDVINGGAGTDTLVAIGSASMALSGFNATAASIEVLEGNGRGIVGTSNPDIFDLSGINLITGSGMGFVDAGAGNDILTGTKFADDLRGGAGTDSLTGGLGNDLMTGGGDADTFFFDAGFGADTIVDFAVGVSSGHDVLNFSTGVFSSYAAVIAAAAQVGKDTVIAAGGGNSVTLQKVTLNTLVAADVSFH